MDASYVVQRNYVLVWVESALLLEYADKPMQAYRLSCSPFLMTCVSSQACERIFLIA